MFQLQKDIEKIKIDYIMNIIGTIKRAIKNI